MNEMTSNGCFIHGFAITPRPSRPVTIATTTPTESTKINNFIHKIPRVSPQPHPHRYRRSPPPRIRSRLSSSSNFGSLRHPGHCQLLLLQQAGRPLAYPAGTHLLLTGSSSLGMYMPQKTLDWDLSIFRRSRRRPRMNVFYTAESIHTDAGDRPGGVGWKNCTRTSAGRVQ